MDPLCTWCCWTESATKDRPLLQRAYNVIVNTGKQQWGEGRGGGHWREAKGRLNPVHLANSHTPQERKRWGAPHGHQKPGQAPGKKIPGLPSPSTMTLSTHGGGGGTPAQRMQRARVGLLPHFPGLVAHLPPASPSPHLALGEWGSK